MNNSVRVEKVTDYTDGVAAGIGKLMPDLSPNLSGEPIPEQRLRAIIESPDREQFIALLHTKIVGAATLNLIIGPAGKKAWLEDFVTSSDENIRGKGAGHRIWQELIKWCKEQGVDLSFTSNPNRQEAHSFYKRQGATLIDTDVFRVNVE